VSRTIISASSRGRILADRAPDALGRPRDAIGRRLDLGDNLIGADEQRDVNGIVRD